MTNFSTIQRLIEDNNGGLKKVQFIDVEEIVSFPSPVDSLISDDIIINEDASAFEIIFTEDTSGFNEDQVIVGRSLYGYTAVLAGIIPKDRREILNQLKRMSQKRFVLIITDFNDFRKVLGSKDEPCFITFNRNNKAVFTERNEYVMSVTTNGRFPVPFIDDANGFVLFEIDRLFENDVIRLFENGETRRFIG